jgi:hypothetical protein
VIVTGCGGTGTAFVASVLRACGVQCGHEHVFTSRGFAGWNGLPVECSWLAVPWLAKTPDAFVVHLLRDPLAVARSMIAFFDCRGELGDHLEPWRLQRDVVRRLCPEIFDLPCLKERVSAYYDRWNAEIDRRENGRILIELITDDDIQRICAITGLHIDKQIAREALASVPTNHNSHSFRDPNLETIPRLDDLRRKYGYA